MIKNKQTNKQNRKKPKKNKKKTPNHKKPFKQNGSPGPTSNTSHWILSDGIPISTQSLHVFFQSNVEARRKDNRKIKKL